MRTLSKPEQEESVRLIRFLLQKINRYTVSHSALSNKTGRERMHDTLQLANAISECEDFLKPFNQETGWRGFVRRLRNKNA